MRTKLRCFQNALITSIALARATVVQAGTLANCDETSLRAAISQGGTISIECDGVLSLISTLVITNAVTLDATGHHVTISGGNSNRVFEVLPGASLTLVNLTVANGRSANGGGILNEGNLAVIRCVVANNVAQGRAGTNGIDGTNGLNWTPSNPVGPTAGSPGTDAEAGQDGFGGGIFNRGSMMSTNSRFEGNRALGGQGGNPGNGGAAGYVRDQFGRIRSCAAPGAPGISGKGGNALGAALYNHGFAVLVENSIVGNVASGGMGGAAGYGGSVPCLPLNYVQSPTGQGGNAQGGGWFNVGTLQIDGSLAANNSSVGGFGGDGPLDTRLNNLATRGGTGGNGVGGAGANIGSNSILNSTIHGNQAVGGTSGLSSKYNGVCLSPGGDGGNAAGGGLFSSGNLDLRAVTLWENIAVAGIPTNRPGQGCGPTYEQLLGKFGTIDGHTLLVSNEIKIATSILGGSALSNQCNGVINDLGHNLCSDSSAGFTATTSRNNIDPLLGPLADNGGATSTISPSPGSPAIDAADNATAPAADQRGVPRPQGLRSDIGAVEATFLAIQRSAGGNVRLSYAGIPGTNYTLESTTHFDEAWNDLETLPASASGGVQFTDRPSTAIELLFRVKARK